jgi:hypothetical protein
MKIITPNLADYRPEFHRLPPPRGRCQLTGLSRTTICELIAERKVRAKKLRKPGAIRGITLVDTQSLIDYLNSLPEAGGEA